MENRIQVSATIYNHSVVYLSEENLVETFNKYGESFQGFYFFCKNIHAWRSPNADMLRFEYCPLTGQKINWDNLYERNKNKLRGYSVELEKDLNE